MKKKEKRIHAAVMLRAAINDYMKRNPMFDKEYCNDSCEDCEQCTVAPAMVAFYDHNHSHLVSNWLSNSYSCCGDCNLSLLIDRLSDLLDIDIAHLMWGSADEYLHKVRYIRIGEREEGENGYVVENGIEYDVHGKSITQYRSKWHNAGIGIA